MNSLVQDLASARRAAVDFKLHETDEERITAARTGSTRCFEPFHENEVCHVEVCAAWRVLLEMERDVRSGSDWVRSSIYRSLVIARSPILPYGAQMI